MTDTTTYTNRQLEDWASIFGASATMWSWWRGLNHVTGDWDVPGTVLLTVEDPDDEDKTVTMECSPEDIFSALRKANRLYPHLFRRFDGYLDLDAGSADVVLQVAIFGEAIYG